MTRQICEATKDLWLKALEQGLEKELAPEVVIGAHYARLHLSGDVVLGGSGQEKVDIAFESLSEMLGEG